MPPFGALREEVAALRRGIEMLHRQVQQSEQQPVAAPGPDYSLTLGKMERALQAIAGRLEGVERQPALMLTPAGLRTEIDSVALSAAQAATRPVHQALGEARAAAQELKDLVGRAHTGQEQRVWLWSVGVVGAAFGVLLWFMLTAALPWGGGTWLAGLAYGGRWNAGEAMIRDASPSEWDRMVRLDRACPRDSAPELCEAAMAVRTVPPLPLGPDGTRAATPPAAPRPSPRGSRVGQQGQ